MNIIEVKDLVKKYGDFVAVDGISFSVEQGEIFGILGPNGAGKTTTLEMIEGLKSITSGEAILAGHNVQRETRIVKQLIGVQLQASSFFNYLNLKELLVTFGALYDRKVNALDLLEKVQLTEKAKSQVKELSGGQKQRFSMATALVNDPKVLFLDEPTTGLDPQARRHMWELISGLNKQGKTIIITTHYMEEAEVLCSRIAIMDHAKIIALDTPKNLMKQSGVKSTITFNVDKPCPNDHFSELPGVAKALLEDHSYRLVSNDPEKTLPELFKHGHQCESNISNLQLRQPTLEDVFIKLTGKKLRD
ncbi:ATP-binding cassette domain-containing protein [Patescibacteria group bacterium]|nr:ATP-binding cassette domain-containing protein [Patescibacteria group bacterium]